MRNKSVVVRVLYSYSIFALSVALPFNSKCIQFLCAYECNVSFSTMCYANLLVGNNNDEFGTVALTFRKFQAVNKSRNDF